MQCHTMLDRLKTTLARLTALGGEEEGQALMEYALVLALVALVAVLALTLISGPVTSIITTVAHPL